MRRLLSLLIAATCAVFVPAWLPLTTRVSAQTDLDALMAQVLARRDDNWRKLQQYILDEREQVELRGPSRTPVWGERRAFTWFIRDGFFVRSPVSFNGAAVSDAERRRYEQDSMRRAEDRERRFGTAGPAPQSSDLDSVIKQTRQPEFVSSSYFLRFRFEEHRYAFVGRETLDGHDLLRIEYYPERLFDRDQRWLGAKPSAVDKARAAELERLMNKTALVTLWVEPTAKQIVKYTFDNVTFDFLPAQWLYQLDDVRASMTLSEVFPDVWLPKDMELSVGLTMAVGRFDLRYAREYRDYRRADVTTKVGIPGER